MKSNPRLIARVLPALCITACTCLTPAIAQTPAATGVPVNNATVAEHAAQAQKRRTRIERARHFVEHLTHPTLDTSIIADDFRILTSSAGYIERDQYLQNLKLSHQLWQVPLTFDISLIRERLGNVVIEASSNGILFTGQPYGNEYLFVIAFDQQDKIHWVREVYDPARIEASYRPAVEAWKARHASAAGAVTD